jgi:hypothetical protein
MPVLPFGDLGVNFENELHHVGEVIHPFFEAERLKPPAFGLESLFATVVGDKWSHDLILD